jgi:hypothetical protein
MDVGAVNGAGGATSAGRAAAPVAPEAAGPFEAVLDEQGRRAAARDLLASLPPPVAQQVARSSAGGAPPLPGVQAMFEAVQDGSFVPGERELRAPFWRALDEAARTFASADELWATARALLGAPAELAAAVEAVRATPETAPSGPHGAALRLLGGALPPAQVEWWAWALEFALLGGDEGRKA